MLFSPLFCSKKSRGVFVRKKKARSKTSKRENKARREKFDCRCPNQEGARKEEQEMGRRESIGGGSETAVCERRSRGKAQSGEREGRREAKATRTDLDGRGERVHLLVVGRAELRRAVREQIRVGEVVNLWGRVSRLAARRKVERGRAKCFFFLFEVDLPPRARVLGATLGWCPCSCSASKGKVCQSEHA